MNAMRPEVPPGEAMTSRERILSAIHRLPADHVPLWIRLWPSGRGIDNVPFPWRDQVARAERFVQMGLDDTLLLEPPLGYVENYDADSVPGVAGHITLAPATGGEPHPILHKTYDTPAGPLRHTVRMTEDWPHGEQIPLFSDFNIPRQTEPLIKNVEDIRRLKYLLGEPGPEQVAESRERARYLRQQANRLGVALEGGWSALGDAAVWLCGMERILYGQMDEPEFIDEVLETLFQWELRRLDHLLEEGVDFITHMAWYEGVDFWTPRSYRAMLKPRLAKIAAKVHARDIPFRYIITKGWRPLRQDFIDIGLDCLTGVDPVQDGVDLVSIKDELGRKMCLMGGVNSAVMFTQWSDQQIREAVAEAIRIMSPGGGFILYPVDSVFDEFPWEKVEVLIETWRKG